MSFTRRLVSGTLYLTISNGIVRLVSVVTMPILTALLTPEDYGLASLVGTVISLLSVFALAGIDVTYAREYSSAQQDRNNLLERFCWRFATKAALVASIVAGVGWWCINRSSADLDPDLAVVVALGIFLSVVCTMAQTRARLLGQYRAMALAILFGGLLGPMASIAIALWWRADAIALLLPMLLSYLLPTILLGTLSIPKMARSSGMRWREGLSLLKIGVAAVVTAPMYWLLSSSDRWVLQYYHGSEAVGVYSIGYNVAVVGMMVNTAVMAVWLPEASREYEQDPVQAQVTLGRLMSRLITVMAIIWLCASAAGGDIVRWLANERFQAAAEFVPFIAGGVFFYGASQLALYGLVLVKQFKWAALWWLGGGLICTILNFALVSRFGGFGAALTQSISFAFIFAGILLTSQSMYPIQLEWGRMVTVLGMIVGIGLILSAAWHSTPSISLLLKFPIGVIVTCLTAWIIAPDWCVRGVQYMSDIMRNGSTLKLKSFSRC